MHHSIKHLVGGKVIGSITSIPFLASPSIASLLTENISEYGTLSFVLVPLISAFNQKRNGNKIKESGFTFSSSGFSILFNILFLGREEILNNLTLLFS